MKKITALVLAILTLLSGICLSACENTGVRFYKVSEIKEGKIEGFPKLSFLKDYSGSKEALVCEIKPDAPQNVTVPSEIDNTPVIGLFSAPEPAESLQNVKILKGVKYIEKCLRKCKELRSIEIPKSVESVKDSFINCESLGSATIKGDVSTLENSFNKCKSLSDVKFEGKLKNGIEGKVFSGCDGIKKLEFDDEILKFDVNTDDFKSLEELVFKGKVTEVGEGCFLDCKKLESVSFQDDVEELKKDSFKACPSLKSVDFSGSVHYIDENSFSGCADLQKVSFKKYVYSIREGAFSNCGNLGAVEFLYDIDTIGNGAFSECKALKSLKFSGKVNKIDANAFSKCGFENLDFNCNINLIGEKAFSECNSLKNVIFRQKVNSIERDAFDECKSLKLTQFKKRISDLSFGAFSGCKKIIVKSMKDVDSDYLRYGWNIGTKLMTDVFDKIDNEKLFKKADKKLGKKFPSSKKISESSARKLAKKYNGPLFYMMYPAKCNYKKYSRKYAKKAGIRNSGLHTEYAGAIECMYPKTVLTNKKMRRILKEKDPIVYCIAEMTGYAGPEVYKSTNTKKTITKKYYHLTYRFSFWNAKNGKLIAWFTHQSGYAPLRYKSSDEGRITRTVDGLGEKRVLLEKNGDYPTCLGFVEKFVFGRKKRSRY